MKRIFFSLIILLVMLFSACKKQNLASPEPLLASISVVNTGSDIGPIYVNRYAAGLRYANQADSLTYQSSREYSMASGVIPLKLVLYRDTSKLIFGGNLNLAASKTYSFYLTGSSTKIDTVFKAESNYPRYADSSVAVRVINLSADGPKVNVSLTSNPTVNDFTALAYKAQSAFKKYSLTNAIASNSGLSFDIKDASSNIVLTNFTLPQYAYSYPAPPTTESARFKAITLVISGSYTSGTYSVFVVPNY